MSREDPWEPAYETLVNELRSSERVEGVVFGGWGGSDNITESPWVDSRYGATFTSIPLALRGKLLSLEEAKPHMQDWAFEGGFGSPDVWACYVWTNMRVFVISQYDGMTLLHGIPRHPTNCEPEVFGGS